MSSDQSKPTSVQLGIASTCSGALCMLCVYPLDMIRAQLTILPRNTFRSIYHAIQWNYYNTQPHIYGLYRGCSYSVLWSTVYYGVQFICYDTMKYYYMQYKFKQMHGTTDLHDGTVYKLQSNTVDGISAFIMGCISGTICTTLAFPLETVRRKLQLQGIDNRPIVYHGFRHCIKSVYRMNGMNGLFNGLVPNLVKSPIAVALIFSLHEIFMNQFKQYNYY